MVATSPWLIVGTVPDASLPCLLGRCVLDGDGLRVRCVPVGPLCAAEGEVVLATSRGTPALLAAATATLAEIGHPSPWLLLVGDTGRGTGSRTLYRAFVEEVFACGGKAAWAEGEGSGEILGITFHYLYPDVDWHSRLLLHLQERPHPPLLVADAGFMYAAKMSGASRHYALYTPDAGELAFLADEQAPHPFYTRGFLLTDETEVEAKVERAYRAGNAAQWLIVKGSRDRIFEQGVLRDTVDAPNVPAMEAIGGTGDLVTGVVTGFLAAGVPLARACSWACRVCRWAGALAKPTPETQIAAILPYIPEAIRRVVDPTEGGEGGA